MSAVLRQALRAAPRAMAASKLTVSFHCLSFPESNLRCPSLPSSWLSHATRTRAISPSLSALSFCVSVCHCALLMLTACEVCYPSYLFSFWFLLLFLRVHPCVLLSLRISSCYRKPCCTISPVDHANGERATVPLLLTNLLPFALLRARGHAVRCCVLLPQVSSFFTPSLTPLAFDDHGTGSAAITGRSCTAHHEYRARDIPSARLQGHRARQRVGL